MKRGCWVAVWVIALALAAAATEKPEGYYRPGNAIQPPTALAPGLGLEGVDADWMRWRDVNRRIPDQRLLSPPLLNQLDLTPGTLTGPSQRVAIDPGATGTPAADPAALAAAASAAGSITHASADSGKLARVTVTLEGL